MRGLESTVSVWTVRAGGIALLTAAVLFSAVFGYLAAIFDYPDILQQPAGVVLPALLATGQTGRALWSLYALLPLLLLPAGAATSVLFRDVRYGASQLANACAILAALSMTLGLARWPTIHWIIAEQYPHSEAATQAALAAVIDGLNMYLGTFIGEIIGEIGLYGFFGATAVAMWSGQTGGYRRLAVLGFFVAGVGAFSIFRHVSSLADPFSDLANVLIPVWLALQGGFFVYCSTKASAAPPETPGER